MYIGYIYGKDNRLEVVGQCYGAHKSGKNTRRIGKMYFQTN